MIDLCLLRRTQFGEEDWSDRKILVWGEMVGTTLQSYRVMAILSRYDQNLLQSCCSLVTVTGYNLYALVRGEIRSL
jgi:hypothetical protein